MLPIKSVLTSDKLTFWLDLLANWVMTQRAARYGEGGEETYMGQGDRCGSAVWKNHSDTTISTIYIYSFLFIVLIFSRLSSLLVSTNLKKGNMSHKSNEEVKETKYIQCNLLYNEDWQEGRERVREREHIRFDDEMNQNRMNHIHCRMNSQVKQNRWTLSHTIPNKL